MQELLNKIKEIAEGYIAKHNDGGKYVLYAESTSYIEEGPGYHSSSPALILCVRKRRTIIDARFIVTPNGIVYSAVYYDDHTGAILEESNFAYEPFNADNDLEGSVIKIFVNNRNFSAQ